MKAEVLYQGEPAGSLQWTEDAYGAAITLDCAASGDPAALLRCYARTKDGALLIGLPEPQGGRLRLSRRLTREALKAAGCDKTPPTAFYLAVQPERVTPQKETGQRRPEDKQTPSLRLTGEPLLDALVRAGEVQCESGDTAVRLCCPFACDRPFALAPAFALCTVSDGRAVLLWDKTKNAPSGE